MEIQIGEIENLKSLLCRAATQSGEPTDESAYKAIRGYLINDITCKQLIPEFMFSIRSLLEFWDFIKPQFPSYSERREFIRQQFEPLCQKLEGASFYPSDQFPELLNSPSCDHIRLIWRKALDRRISDPEGAITSARTLLECICKYILDNEKIEYHDDSDLPQLYKLVAKKLNLSPGQHTNEIFKQILSGCTSVIVGLGAVRNKLSDAHGRSTVYAKPDARHAELTVNLAGSMASFLLQTFENKKQDQLISADAKVIALVTD